MKEVRIKFKDLSQDRRDAIIKLKDWLYHLYKDKGVTDYYQTHNWLSMVINNHPPINADDLKALRELWDTYVEYKRMEKEDA